LPVKKFGNSNDSEQDNKHQCATEQNKTGFLWQIQITEQSPINPNNRNKYQWQGRHMELTCTNNPL
jgi:hypothetical protein